jgi:PIN domain nuclease of toxin-antitoxin system
VKLLLDTHALIWWLEDSAELSADARRSIADGTNDVAVSAASAWEMAIKAALGKLRVPSDLTMQIEQSALQALPITIEHAFKAGSLPPHHQDPFDRMLIAQAMIDDRTIVTRDPRFELYGVKVLNT